MTLDLATSIAIRATAEALASYAESVDDALARSPEGARLMGLNDTREQLAVCHEVNVANEARITQLETDLATVTRELDATEHDLAKVESALADRLRADAHGVAAIEADLTSARERLARISALVDPRRDDWSPLTAGIIRRIVDETTAEPWGAYLDLDEARLAERACRHSAAAIRSVALVDPDRLHPDVLPYAARLDTLADRLAR